MRRFRPQLESLDARIVPSRTLVWQPTAAGYQNASTALNWHIDTDSGSAATTPPDTTDDLIFPAGRSDCLLNQDTYHSIDSTGFSNSLKLKAASGLTLSSNSHLEGRIVDFDGGHHVKLYGTTDWDAAFDHGFGEPLAYLDIYGTVTQTGYSLFAGNLAVKNGGTWNTTNQQLQLRDTCAVGVEAGGTWNMNGGSLTLYDGGSSFIFTNGGTTNFDAGVGNLLYGPIVNTGGGVMHVYDYLAVTGSGYWGSQNVSILNDGSTAAFCLYAGADLRVSNNILFTAGAMYCDSYDSSNSCTIGKTDNGNFAAITFNNATLYLGHYTDSPGYVDLTLSNGTGTCTLNFGSGGKLDLWLDYANNIAGKIHVSKLACGASTTCVVHAIGNSVAGAWVIVDTSDSNSNDFAAYDLSYANGCGHDWISSHQDLRITQASVGLPPHAQGGEGPSGGG